MTKLKWRKPELRIEATFDDCAEEYVVLMQGYSL